MSTGGDLCDLHRTGPRYTQFYDLGHGDTGQMNIEIWMRRTGNKSSAHFTNLVRIIILVSIPGFPNSRYYHHHFQAVSASLQTSPIYHDYLLASVCRAVYIEKFILQVLSRAAQCYNATYQLCAATS